jgi:hypothetical protein
MMLKVCEYCGRAGSSREHVWPRWVREHALLTMGVEDVAVQDYVGHKEQRGRPREKLAWRGGHSRLSLTIRDVCAECNTGWMSRLEQDVRPVLQPMIEGKSVAIDSQQSSHLQAWAAKTALNFAIAGRRALTRPIPRSFANDLYAHRNGSAAPPHVQVMVAKYTSLGQFAYRHMLAQGFGISPASGEELIIQRTIFIVGHAVFLVRRADKREGFRLQPGETSAAFRPIFEVPPGREIPWPVGEGLDDAGISEAMNRHIHGGIYPGEQDDLWTGLIYSSPAGTTD